MLNRYSKVYGSHFRSLCLQNLIAQNNIDCLFCNLTNVHKTEAFLHHAIVDRFTSTWYINSIVKSLWLQLFFRSFFNNYTKFNFTEKYVVGTTGGNLVSIQEEDAPLHHEPYYAYV